MKKKNKFVLFLIFLFIIIISIIYLFSIIKDNEIKKESVVKASLTDGIKYNDFYQNNEGLKEIDKQKGTIDTQLIDLSKFSNKEFEFVYNEAKALYPLIISENYFEKCGFIYHDCMDGGAFRFTYYIDSTHLFIMTVYLPLHLIESLLKAECKIDLELLKKEKIYKIYQNIIDLNKYKSYKLKLRRVNPGLGKINDIFINAADSVTNYRKKYPYYMLIPNQ